jgi:alanine dehydrogenase
MLRSGGVFVASLGSPREVDPFLLKAVKVVPETVVECAKRGKTGVAIRSGAISLEDVFIDLPSIVAGKSRGRTGDDESFLLDSIGLAEEDLCVANMIFDKANKTKAGSQVDF